MQMVDETEHWRQELELQGKTGKDFHWDGKLCDELSDTWQWDL